MKEEKMKSDTKDLKSKSLNGGTLHQKVDDDIYLEERIVIPYQETESSFSWRKLWLFTGPGWLSKSHFQSSFFKHLIIFRFSFW